jgi:hypothetical protein
MMHILIDGHNLIAQMPGLSLAASDDEYQLVLRLRRYAQRQRGRKLVVVFDRGVYGHPDNLKGYGVEVHFARAPADADRELIRRIRKITHTKRWHVVSSDRAVAGEAKARGITVLSAQEFARKLEQTSEPRASVQHKHSEKPLRETQINEWLRLFGAEDEMNDGL